MDTSKCSDFMGKFKINNFERIIFYLSLVLVTLTTERLLTHEYNLMSSFIKLKEEK